MLREVYGLLKFNSLHSARQSDTAGPEETKRTQIRNSLLSTGVQVCWDQPGFPIPRQHWSVAFVAGVAEQFVSVLCPSACLQILPQWEKSNPANSNSNNYILAVPRNHKNTAPRPNHWKHFPPLSPHTYMNSNSIFHQRFKISFAFNAIWYFVYNAVSIASSTNRSNINTEVQEWYLWRNTQHTYSLCSLVLQTPHWLPDKLQLPLTPTNLFYLHGLCLVHCFDCCLCHGSCCKSHKCTTWGKNK